MSPTKNGKPSLQQQILNAAASLAREPNKKVSRKTVAKRCGFGRKESKVYGNALGLMKNKKHYITYDKEYITILDAGFNLADLEAPVGSNEDALQDAKEKVKNAKGKQILDIVADGAIHSCEEIKRLVAPDLGSKSFGNLITILKGQQFIEYTKTKEGDKAIKATEDLIPFDSGSKAEEKEEE